MVIATILDPRYKMRFITWCFQQMYEPIKAETELDDIRIELEKLFETFETEHRCSKPKSSESSTLVLNSPPQVSSSPSYVPLLQGH